MLSDIGQTERDPVEPQTKSSTRSTDCWWALAGPMLAITVHTHECRRRIHCHTVTLHVKCISRKPTKHHGTLEPPARAGRTGHPDLEGTPGWARGGGDVLTSPVRVLHSARIPSRSLERPAPASVGSGGLAQLCLSSGHPPVCPRGPCPVRGRPRPCARRQAL